jgi:hypothetical protein
VFDTDVYVPRFGFEDKDNNMDPLEIHKKGLKNAHAKSAHTEVCVYPAEWKKETECKIIRTANNDHENDIDLHGYNDEDRKPNDDLH